MRIALDRKGHCGSFWPAVLLALLLVGLLGSCAREEEQPKPVEPEPIEAPTVSEEEARYAQEQRDARVVEAVCTRMLSSLEQTDRKSLEPYLTPLEEELDTLKDYDVDVYDIVTHCFDRYSWHIDEVRVSGNAAQVVATIQNVDIASIMEQATQAIDDDPSELHDLYEEEGFEALMHELFEEAYERLDESDELVSTQITLGLSKSADGIWELGDKSIHEFAHAAMGGGAEED